MQIPKQNKYKAQPTWVDGIRFASKREAKRYSELKLLETARKITCLERQKRYALTVIETPIGHYVADFMYIDMDTGERVVEDTKGFRTPLYKWKKRHFEAQYGIPIKET